MDHEYCRDCGEERPVAESTRNRNSRDGLAFYCREHARRRHRRSRDERVGTPARRHPRDVVVPEGHKWCPDCGTVLPLSSLGQNAAGSSGVNSYCKPCHNARGRVSKDKIAGEVRALLCSGCNGGLGQFKDDPDALHAAAYYVAFHKARQDIVAAMRPPSHS